MLEYILYLNYCFFNKYLYIFIQYFLVLKKLSIIGTSVNSITVFALFCIQISKYPLNK